MPNPTAIIDQPSEIGKGTKIWHFSHVMSGGTVGSGCNLGQNVVVASGVKIGNNVKIQITSLFIRVSSWENDRFLRAVHGFSPMLSILAATSLEKSEYKKTLVRTWRLPRGQLSQFCAELPIGEFCLHWGRSGGDP